MSYYQEMIGAFAPQGFQSLNHPTTPHPWAEQQGLQSSFSPSLISRMMDQRFFATLLAFSSTRNWFVRMKILHS